METLNLNFYGVSRKQNDMSDPVWKNFLSFFQNLKHLKIVNANLETWKDKHWDHFVSRLPNLESILFRCCFLSSGEKDPLF